MATTEAQKAARPAGEAVVVAAAPRPKLHGRAFYESIGSPKYVLAPMVDQSEFAWRMLSRSFLPHPQRSSLLAYTPMLHARLYTETEKYRQSHFQPTKAASETDPTPVPYLDGNPRIDRPLFVQFCANDPDALLEAAARVAPYCDAVDLNLGCPQGIAKKGHYGAFLQEDQDLIYRLINRLHQSLPVPVTAKIRMLDTREATLAYAQNVLAAGASILTVHGRRREQKGHMTGLADWGMIRYLRENLPAETVLFANGNILRHGDLQRCLEATGADGVMSAEGNLSDPAIFGTEPAPDCETREYWRGKDGRGGWRVDAVMRRYLDILHRHVLDTDPPPRRPLFLPGDDDSWVSHPVTGDDRDEPARKKRKKDAGGRGGREAPNPNLVAMQAHMFHLLRHLVTKHTDVRDRLARSKSGDVDAYELILGMVEQRVAQGLIEYERTDGRSVEEEGGAVKESLPNGDGSANGEPAADSSAATARSSRRPWWIAQPIIRPLPDEALAKGALTLSKKDKAKLAAHAKLSQPAVPAQPRLGTTTTESVVEEGKTLQNGDRLADGLASG